MASAGAADCVFQLVQPAKARIKPRASRDTLTSVAGVDYPFVACAPLGKLRANGRVRISSQPQVWEDTGRQGRGEGPIGEVAGLLGDSERANRGAGHMHGQSGDNVSSGYGNLSLPRRLALHPHRPRVVVTLWPEPRVGATSECRDDFQ